MTLTKDSVANRVFVFDLDDTLYQESDYQSSGFREVVRWLERIYGIQLDFTLDEFLAENNSDVLGGLCEAAHLPDIVKQSLLWVYRLHEPDISLSEPVSQTITVLEQKSAGLAILTDGRSITQRLKLKALGLSHIPAYISEDYADEKPSPIRFQKIMQDMPAQYYVYVADNPKKDFIAPNQLGWLTIGVSARPQNIHSQQLDILSEDHWPSVWVSKLSDFLLSPKC